MELWVCVWRRHARRKHPSSLSLSLSLSLFPSQPVGIHFNCNFPAFGVHQSRLSYSAGRVMLPNHTLFIRKWHYSAWDNPASCARAIIDTLPRRISESVRWISLQQHGSHATAAYRFHGSTARCGSTLALRMLSGRSSKKSWFRTKTFTRSCVVTWHDDF